MTLHDPAVAPSCVASRTVPRRYEHILQPIDLTDPTGRALEEAEGIAAASGGTVCLLHVVPTDEIHLLRSVYRPSEGGGANEDWAQTVAQRHLEEIAARRKSELFRHEIRVRTGDPAEEILTAATAMPADLIVLSTHGRSGMSHFLLGSVAEAVIRRAPCPVLTLRRTPA